LPLQLRAKGYDGPPVKKGGKVPAGNGQGPGEGGESRKPLKRAAAARKPQRRKRPRRKRSADGSNRGTHHMGGEAHDGVVAFRALTLGREAVMLGRVQVGEIMPTDGGRHQACFRLTLPEASTSSMWRPARDLADAPAPRARENQRLAQRGRICGRMVQHEDLDETGAHRSLAAAGWRLRSTSPPSLTLPDRWRWRQFSKIWPR
jgi:hypothetical protein